jgi:hypothetical protein
VPQEDNSGTFLRAERFYRGAAVAALPDYVDYDFASGCCCSPA